MCSQSWGPGIGHTVKSSCGVKCVLVCSEDINANRANVILVALFIIPWDARWYTALNRCVIPKALTTSDKCLLLKCDPLPDLMILGTPYHSHSQKIASTHLANLSTITSKYIYPFVLCSAPMTVKSMLMSLNGASGNFPTKGLCSLHLRQWAM